MKSPEKYRILFYGHDIILSKNISLNAVRTDESVLQAAYILKSVAVYAGT